MDREIKEQFQKLIDWITPMIEEYKLSKEHRNSFDKFSQIYSNDPKSFFSSINETEVSFLEKSGNYHPLYTTEKKGNHFLRESEINQFHKGDILVKKMANKETIFNLKSEISKILNSGEEFISSNFIHFCSPKIISFIYQKKERLRNHAASIFNSQDSLSLGVGYFKINPMTNNPIWHDDYSLFNNRYINNSCTKSKILNYHLALTDVTEKTSPMFFLGGSEDVVYARAAFEYFKYKKINFNEETFLKATYLGENIRSTGQKVKENILAQLPNYYYRLYHLKEGLKAYRPFFRGVSAGEFLIFSPSVMHGAPLINLEKDARETFVFRVFNDNAFDDRATVKLSVLMKYISFAKNREISIESVREALFDSDQEVDENSEVVLNLDFSRCVDAKYKSGINKYRIALDDLFRFYCEE